MFANGAILGLLKIYYHVSVGLYIFSKLDLKSIRIIFKQNLLSLSV